MKPETERALKGIGVVAGVLGVAFLASKVQAKPCTPGDPDCIGYDLYRCSLEGVWVLEEANSPTCGWEPGDAEFTVTGLVIEPTEVYVGEKVFVSVTVTNVGGEAGTKTVVAEGIGSADVTLAPGDSAPVTFEIVTKQAGTYPISVSGLSGSFTVYALPECTEGEAKCIGYGLYQCVGGEWILIEENSTECGYTPPEPPSGPVFEVEHRWPDTAKEYSHIYFHFLVTNIGDTGGKTALTLRAADGTTEDSRQIYLRPGQSWDVQLRSTGRTIGTHTFTVDEWNVTTMRMSSFSVIIEILPRFGAIEGRLYDATTGKGVDYYTWYWCVHAVYISEDYPDEWSVCGGGGFGHHTCYRGEYELTATAEGYYSETKIVTVVVGETTHVDFHLVPIE